MRSLLALLLLALLLVSCTGTREDRLPTLLVVGAATPAGGELRLLEDVFDPIGTPARTLLPVPDGTRPLPAPPVSLAVVDPLGARSELVVLSVGGGVSQLHFFDISGVDPETGTGFEESRAAIDLAGLLTDAGRGAEAACLSEVGVTGGIGGETLWAALFDDGSCGNQFPEVFLVDVSGRSLEAAPLLADLAGAGIHADDSSDRLYFARDDIGATAVEYLPLPDGDRTRLGSADLSDLDLRDLAPVAGGMALLENGELAVVPLQGDSTGDELAPAVSTITDGRFLLPDPYGVLGELVVVGNDRVAVHLDHEDGDPFLITNVRDVVAATMDPLNRFAYLLSEGGVYILDMIRREDDPQPYGSFLVELEAASDPLAVEWIFARQTLP